MIVVKRGSVQIEFLILGVVVLTALAGFVLLISEPGHSAYGVSDAYGADRGISRITPLPRYEPWGPTPEVPSGPMETVGSRTPIMIFFKGEYRTIREMSVCWNDLAFKMAAPRDAFSCYSVPTTGPAEEVTGFFWPSSSSEPKPFYQIGGDVYCYERTPYNRTQLMERIFELGKEKGWAMGEMNGEQVLFCQKGQRFLYPQGFKS